MNASRDYPKLLTPELQSAVRDHDLAEAVRLFETPNAAHPGSLELWAELLDELAHHGYSWADWLEAWPGGEEGLERGVYFLVLGIRALQEEAFERASFFLNRCVETRPDSPVPLAYMGIMYESQGCPAEALATYRRCLDLDPELFSVLNAVGNLFHELGFYDESVTYYRRAYPLLNEAVNQSILLGNLGNSLRALGQRDEAIAVYTEAIALDATQSANPIALAETLLEEKRAALVVMCLNDLLQAPAFDDWPPEAQRKCYGLLARAYALERQFPACCLFLWLHNGSWLNEEDRDGVSMMLKGLFCWAIEAPGAAANEFLLAKLNRHLGYLDAALHHAKRSVKLQPERAEHFIELGATLLLQGKLPVALEAFEEAAGLAPERAEIHAFRAMALWETDMDEAETALHEASRLEPNQAMHYCDLAYLHHAEGHQFLTQDAFQKAVLLWENAPVIYGPHGPAAQRGCFSDVTERFLAENATSPEAATRLLTAANFLILSRRREAARKALHRLLSEQPEHLDALRTYAWLLTREGFTQEALSVWRRVLAIAPDDDVSRYFAITCQTRDVSTGKVKALAELEKALDSRPDYFLGRLLYAKLLDPEPEALRHLELLCKQLPGIYSTWFRLGQSHFHRRAFDEALPSLTRAAELNPQFAPVHQLLAHSHQQVGDAEEADAAMGYFLLLSGKPHQARMSFEDALFMNPEHPAALAGMQRVERRLGRLESPTPADLYTVIGSRYRLF